MNAKYAFYNDGKKVDLEKDDMRYIFEKHVSDNGSGNDLKIMPISIYIWSYDF